MTEILWRTLWTAPESLRKGQSGVSPCPGKGQVRAVVECPVCGPAEHAEGRHVRTCKCPVRGMLRVSRGVSDRAGYGRPIGTRLTAMRFTGFPSGWRRTTPVANTAESGTSVILPCLRAINRADAASATIGGVE